MIYTLNYFSNRKYLLCLSNFAKIKKQCSNISSNIEKGNYEEINVYFMLNKLISC